MKNITQRVIEEVVKVHFDYPELTIKECIDKTRELIEDEKNKRDIENNLY